MANVIPKQQYDEIVKCGKDPIYFINKYIFIQHPTKGKLRLKLFDFQTKCIKDFVNNKFNIVLKSRQLGLSTISAAYSIWDALFHKNRNILIIATKEKVAINLINKVKYAIDNMPDWLKISKCKSNRSTVTFDNGSEIKAITTSADAGRSEALSLLIVDEAAFIEGFDDLWTGLYPTLSTGGRAIVMSTPNGVGGTYYDLWVKAESGENKFNPIRLPYTVHPEHDEEWYKEQCANLGTKKRIAQELCCDFVASGDTFLNTDTLSELLTAIQPPMRKEGWDSNVWIWAEPYPDTKYVITADISRGDMAGDFSTFHIMNLTDYMIVGEYRGKASPDRMAEMLFEYGKKYNNALICNENNTYGYTTSTRLRGMNYENLYFDEKYLIKDVWGATKIREDAIAGWHTNVKTRPIMLSRLEILLREGKLYTQSQRLYDELQTFIWQGSRAAAANGSHDDLVMSIAIMSNFIPDDVVGDKRESDYARELAMLSATKVEKQTTASKQFAIMGASPLGFDGLNSHKKYDLRSLSYRGLDMKWVISLYLVL